MTNFKKLFKQLIKQKVIKTLVQLMTDIIFILEPSVTLKSRVGLWELLTKLSVKLRSWFNVPG